ncbi:hypothetical protein D3C80_751130 [compost metagenome]
MPELFMEMLSTDRRQTEKVFPLPDPDDHTDARGESDNHRVGDKLDDRTEPCHPQQ